MPVDNVEASAETKANFMEVLEERNSENMFSIDESKLERFQDNETYTSNDIKDRFRNYASSQACVTLPKAYNQDSTTANVVGVVLDYYDETPVAGATISVNGSTLVVTDSDGRFQITNMPDGKYDWNISATGFCESNYYNYTVDSFSGTNIFTFYLNEKETVDVDRNEFFGTEHSHEDSKSETQDANIPSLEPLSVNVMTDAPEVSSTVSVYYNGSAKTVDREYYLATVISSELYDAGVYLDYDLTETQVWQLYVAQAIVANTWLEYAQSVYSNHNSYDVCNNSGCCHAYDTTKRTEMGITAASDIFYTVNNRPTVVEFFYQPNGSSSYNYVCARYFSSCGNAGTQTYNTEPACQSVPCTDLFIAKVTKTKYGMCQMGAAQLAKDGYNAVGIVKYYYTNVDTDFCPLD